MKNENLVPKVRFKGFSDPWEQRKLGDISKITAGGDIDKDKLSTRGRYPVIANALTNNGVVGYYDSYKVKGPAVTVTGRGDVGHAKTRIESFTPIVRLLVVSAPNFDINFLENAINNIRIFNESTGVPQLTAPQLGSYEFEYPCSSEQVCIGNVLHKIDNLIAANEDKLEQLKTLKKLMMQKIFSQEWRFKGFTDPWEQRKLGELGKIQGGGTPDSGIAEYWDGNVNWFTPTEVSNNGYLESSNRKITSLGLKKSSARLMPASTVLITSRAGVGRMGILKYPASTNQGFQSLILNSATDEYFIYSMQPIISKLANRLASGSTFTEISGKQMEKIEIMIPTTGEQTRISSLMKCINNLIAANEDKLNQLKELKKYLMQNMFV